MLRIRRTRYCLPLMTALLTIAAVAPARGATTLRWKFTPGETLRYVMHMKMTMKFDSAAAPVTTTATQVSEMSWVIESVDADGVASVTQTIDRMQMKMISPQGVMIDYDSSGNGETGGMSKMLAPLLEAMVNKPISLKVDPRGQQSDVQVPQSMIDGANKIPGLGSMLSGDTIGQMSGLGTLPKDAVSEGDVWTNEREISLPTIGKMEVLAKFEYLGKETRDGRELEKIRPTQHMDISPAKEAAGGAAKITDQSVSGTTYFDNVAGRFAEAEMTSTMKMEIAVGEMTMKMETVTEVRMKLESSSVVEKPAAKQ